MFPQICVLNLEALELAFALLPGWLHVYASMCCWTWEWDSFQVFARCFLVLGKHIFEFTSQGKQVTWCLFQKAKSTDGYHRWFLRLLSASCVPLLVISFLNNFVLETIMEEIERMEKKKNTVLWLYDNTETGKATLRLVYTEIVYLRWWSCSVHLREFNLSSSEGWDTIVSSC